MTRSPMVAGMAIGVLMSLLVAPAALADTCCANVPVVLDPPSATPGATVRLIGMQCLNYDGTQTNPLKLWAVLADIAVSGDSRRGAA